VDLGPRGGPPWSAIMESIKNLGVTHPSGVE